MELRARLLGSWRLASSDWRDDAGPVDSPLGADPVGLLVYDDAGTVSVQLMRRHQQRFSDDDWRAAGAHEKAAAWSGYFCYFGSFVVDEHARTVTHRIEGSWFPNLVGTDQVRSCEFAGDRLFLTAQTPWGRVTLAWERRAI